jgi:outer membrane protein OmpA-like peptidoglycan-associated protein
VRPLPFNSDEYSCRHPSMSADGMTLYFSSDMPGGFGGFDVYRVKKEGADWSKPENLGAEINTASREGFPFVHESGALFFASEGHNSLGGYDIFLAKSTEKTTDFNEISNIGAPFNSEKDDLGFILDASATRGFFSSTRSPSTGEDDIYEFTAEDGLHGINLQETMRAPIAVTDAFSGQALQGASIRVLERSQDGYASGGDFYDVVLQPDENGSDNLALRLVRKNAEDLGKTDLYSNARGEALFDFVPGKDYLLVVSLDGYKVGDKLYTGEEKPTGNLAILLEPLPKCRPIRGVVKTETYGTPIVNAVVKFVDSKSGKQEMVRTNLNGEFDFCLGLEGNWTLLAEKEGFIGKADLINLASTDKIFKEIKLARDRIIQNDVPQSNFAPQPLAVGSVITLDKIYYDFNKATLNESACRQLEGLVAVMKQYPSMEIDLLAHTDTRGGAAENTKLATARAQNAKAYVVARGIPDSRINAVGKGESEPRNQCRDGVECTEDQHAYNRRTEVKVRKINEGVKVEYKGN